MGDRQGRHLAPDTGASPQRSAAPRHSAPETEAPRPRHSVPETEAPRPRRSAPAQTDIPRRRRPEEGEAPRRRAAEKSRRSRPEPAEKEAQSPRRRRSGKKPRRTLFRRILLIYLAILGVITGYLQLRLWLYLDHSQTQMEQEAANKKALFQAPQLAFEQWWDEQTGEDWAALCSSGQVSPVESRERVTDYLASLFSPGSAQAYKDASFTSQAPVYLIKNGDLPLARVALSGQDLDWYVSNVEMLLSADRSVTVTVPASCTVSFNGIQLDEQYRQPAESILQYEPVKSQLKTPVTWVDYTVDGLLAEPVIAVTPPEGFETIQDDDGNYLITLPEDNTGSYPLQSVKFVRAFLNYYMNGYHNTWNNLYSVLAYLDEGTQAYEDVEHTYSSVSFASYYLDIDTTKTQAGNVIVWADNCFSVDVTYDADATMMGEPVDYANATMRVYYMKSGDGFYISHFETL